MRLTISSTSTVEPCRSVQVIARRSAVSDSESVKSLTEWQFANVLPVESMTPTTLSRCARRRASATRTGVSTWRSSAASRPTSTRLSTKDDVPKSRVCIRLLPVVCFFLRQTVFNSLRSYHACSCIALCSREMERSDGSKSYAGFF